MSTNGTRRTPEETVIQTLIRAARNNGQPAWHPSGRSLVVQAEKAESTIAHVTTPGAGVLNDLWLMDLETRAVWPIREVPGPVGGTLHAHFSHDGRQLSWSELYGPASGEPGHEVGLWKLMTADSSWHADGDRFVVMTFLAGADGPSVVTGGKPLAESVLLVRPAPRWCSQWTT